MITFRAFKIRFNYEFGEIEKNKDDEAQFFCYCPKKWQSQATRLINQCQDIKIVERFTVSDRLCYLIEKK